VKRAKRHAPPPKPRNPVALVRLQRDPEALE
jgi:hypothetical protein